MDSTDLALVIINAFGIGMNTAAIVLPGPQLRKLRAALLVLHIALLAWVLA